MPQEPVGYLKSDGKHQRVPFWTEKCTFLNLLCNNEYSQLWSNNMQLEIGNSVLVF